MSSLDAIVARLITSTVKYTVVGNFVCYFELDGRNFNECLLGYSAKLVWMVKDKRGDNALVAKKADSFQGAHLTKMESRYRLWQSVMSSSDGV